MQQKPSNAILRDFDDYQMDGAGHVIANNDDNIIYNNQLYCYSNLSKQKFCCNNIFCCNKVFFYNNKNILLQQSFFAMKFLLQ